MAFGFDIKVGLDSSAVNRGLRSIGTRAERLNVGFGRLAGTGLKFAAAIGAAGAAFAAFKGLEFLKESSKQAADFETMTVAFESLLGSAAKAETRMRAIKDFAVVTPFEPKELAAASRLLQSLTGDALAIGDGLTFVGDSAAQSAQPLEEVALHVGRIFAAITQGTSAGESVNRLQEIGLLASGAKQRFEELAAAQKKGKAATMDTAGAMAFLRENMTTAEGAMLKFSATFAGKMSTLRGNIDLFKASVGEGINKALEGAVDRLNTTIPGMEGAGKALGEKIGFWISEGLKGNTALFEAALISMLARGAEIATAVALTTAQKGGSAILGKLADLPSLPGPGTGIGLAARENAAKAPTLSEALSLTENMFGSREAQADLRRIRELAEKEQMTRDFREGRRDIVNGEFGPLKYSR